MVKRRIIRQQDFSAGEIDPTALRADDAEIYNAALKTARNVRILNTRALRRRPGSKTLFTTVGIVHDIRPSDNEYWTMTFEAGKVIFREGNNTAGQEITGMPWSAAILQDLSWALNGRVVSVAHPTFNWIDFTFSLATRLWTNATGVVLQDQHGAYRLPFFNFTEQSGATMRISGLGTIGVPGSVHLYMSEDVFVSGHQGLVFRYANRQLRINTVLNGTEALAEPLEELPPTFVISLTSVAGFQVGDAIEGTESGCQGIVTEVAPGGFADRLKVLILKNFEGFQVTPTKEKIVSPRSKSEIQVQVTAASASEEYGATTIWDEQFWSDYRGWPGSVTYDQQRRIFTRFSQLGRAVIWSAIAAPNDFKIGASARDAMFELVPENCQVYDVIGGADEFIFTDVGVYNIPISASSPLQPGSVDFRQISSDAAAAIRPINTTEGVIFINKARTRVMAIVGTGQVTRPYIIEDISEFHAHLIDTPVALAISSADVSAPERYLYVVNSNGTIAVCQYRQKAKWPGWLPWHFDGAAKWISSAGPNISVTIEFDGRRVCAREAADLFIDGAIRIGDEYGRQPLELDNGEVLELDGGDVLVLDDTSHLSWAAGDELHIQTPNWFRGLATIDAGSGLFSAPIAVNDFANCWAGWYSPVVITPFVGQTPEGASERQALRKRRIAQAGATVYETQALEISGRLIPFYKPSESQEIAPPLRSEVYRARVPGRAFDPEWTIRQDLPGAFVLLELTTEVTI